MNQSITLDSFNVDYCPNCGSDNIYTSRVDLQMKIFEWVEESGDRDFIEQLMGVCEQLYADHPETLNEVAMLLSVSNGPENKKIVKFIHEDLL